MAAIETLEERILLSAPSLEHLFETLHTPVITGAGPGGGPHVRVTGETNGAPHDLIAFDSQFSGGVSVASGDVDGDGVDDIITGAGPGGGPHVRVLNGVNGSILRDFFAYGDLFQGGVFVASGDVNGDGFDEIITGAGPGGGPHVRVFNGMDGTILREFFAYESKFTGGVSVASGDVDGDGFDDIITGAGPGGGPHVRIINGVDGSILQEFFAYETLFAGGVFVGSGDVNGDEFDDIITGAGPGAGPHVRVISGMDGAVLHNFYAYDSQFSGGVSVASGDVDGDGFDDIITGAGPGGGPHVQTFNGLNGQVLDSFFAYDAQFTGGVFVAAQRTRENPTEENRPPVLDEIDNQSVDEGSTLTFVAQASDPDGDMLIYSLAPGSPTGASIDPITGLSKNAKFVQGPV